MKSGDFLYKKSKSVDLKADVPIGCDLKWNCLNSSVKK
ncbi:hypothetical protein LEP1GSC125_2105 [Leptospira mayottensis 200901122]|uniref:Uncharacterized protein n=1 Tax=Leptospira mayottensis 200901122 TaxID=1193010 RepID=A0AA87MS25_9LEPT|nr:hypothetical protein LEP1GSC125_2105 [Leptospira mayottensis 200901122]